MKSASPQRRGKKARHEEGEEDEEEDAQPRTPSRRAAAAVAAPVESSDEEDVTVAKFMKHFVRSRRRRSFALTRGLTLDSLVEILHDNTRKQDEKFEKRLKELKAQILEEVGVSSDRSTGGDSRLAQRVAALESRSAAASVASSAPAAQHRAGGGGGGGPQFGFQPYEPFAPTKVTLQWLGDDDSYKDEDNMTTDEEAGDFLEKMRAAGINMDLFDKEATLRANTKPLATKILLKVRPDHGMDPKQVDRAAWDFKRALEHQASLGTLAIRGRKPRARVQAAPHVEEMIDMTGRALGILRKLGFARGELKPQWQPSKVFVRKGTDRSAMLVEWSSKNGWGVSEASLAKFLPDVTPQQLLAQLRE